MTNKKKSSTFILTTLSIQQLNPTALLNVGDAYNFHNKEMWTLFFRDIQTMQKKNWVTPLSLSKWNKILHESCSPALQYMHTCVSDSNCLCTCVWTGGSLSCTLARASVCVCAFMCTQRVPFLSFCNIYKW